MQLSTQTHDVRECALNRVYRIVDWLSLTAALFSACLCLIMAGLIAYEVVMRAVFNASTSFATELSVYIIAAVAFLGAAFNVREDHHVKVDVVVSRLSNKTRAIVDILSCGLV